MDEDLQKEIDLALSDIELERALGAGMDEGMREQHALAIEPAEDPYQDKPIAIKFGKWEDGRSLTEEEFAYHVAVRIRAGVDARKSMDDMVREFRDIYDSRLPPKNEPFEGCSNFNVALTQPIVDTLHANYYATFFSQSKYFTGVLPTKVNTADAESKEQAMQWIMEEVVDLPKVADELLLRSLIDKGAIAKVEWEKTFKKKMTREPDKTTGRMRTYEAVVPDFDGVKVSVIDFLNYGFYPADAPTREEILLEFHRFAASRDDLNRGVLSGRYDRDAVKRLTKDPSNWTRNDTETGGQEDTIQGSGIDTETWVSDTDKPYELFQCLYKYDCDGSGVFSYLLLEIALQGDDEANATLLRANYYPYDHGRSWYVPVSPFLRPGFLYPYSEVERLEDSQAEINAIQNMRTDRAVLENNAPMVADETLRRQIGATRLAPGKILYSQNPKDAGIYPVSFATGSQRTPEEVGSIRALAEDIAGLNSQVMGRASGEATAREVEGARQGVNIKFDVQQKRLARAFEEIAQQTAELYAQYQPPSWDFAVKEGGLSWDWKTITREQMATKMGFRVKGTSSLANPEFRAYIGEKLILLSERSPLMMNNLARLHAVQQYYLENVAGILDYEKYIGTREEATAQQRAQEAAQANAVEEKAAISYRADEMLTLSHALEKGWVTEESYNRAVMLSIAAQMAMPAVPEGVNVQDATDNAAGYEKQEAAPGGIG
jgi:hypothetical protein